MWFQAVTAQSLVERNIHFNGPRAGLNFNDQFGGGDLIRSNLLFNCVRESGDHGPFNSWDRLPYITTVRNGTPSIVPEFREITQNFIIGVYASQEAIDTDDGSAYYNTHDNFFAYGANGLKSDYGGHHNYHNRNVYAFVGDCWGNGNSNQFINNTCIAISKVGGFRSDCSSSPFQTVSGNKVFNLDGRWGISVCDSSNTIANWPSDADIIEMGRDVMNMTKSQIVV